MTDDQDALLQEYEAIRKEIASLRSALAAAGSHMKSLGDQLQRDPTQVTAEGGEFSITDEFYVSNLGGVAAIKYQTISAEAIEKNLNELASCMASKHGVEQRLRSAGLASHIEK